MRNTEDDKKELLEVLEIELSAAYGCLEGIDRCTDRMLQLIKLESPMVIVRNEVRMIQYRALAALSIYEAYALAKTATLDDSEVKGDTG